MKKFLSILLLIVFITFAPAYTKEVDNKKLPTPSALEPGWWDTFQNLDRQQLKKEIGEFINKLRGELSSLPEEEQKRGKALIDKIALDLQNYESTRFLPLPTPPEPSLIASNYSLGGVLNVYREIRKQKVELETNEADLSQKKAQLAATQKALALAKSHYDTTEARSEKRLFAGLEVIALRIESAVGELNINLLQRLIVAKRSAIHDKEEELNQALARLTISDIDLFLYAQEVKTKEREWEKANDTLIKIQGKKAEGLSETVSDNDMGDYQRFAQQMQQASIQEASAHTLYLFAQSQFALARLISVPGEVDLGSLRKKSSSWDAELDIIKKQIAGWRLSAQKQIEHSSQVLNPNKEKDGYSNSDSEIIKIAQQNLLLLEQLSNEVDDTRFLLDNVGKQLSIKIGGGRRWLEQTWGILVAIARQTEFWFSKEIVVIGNTSVTFLGILRFFIILVATFWLSRIAMNSLLRIGKDRKGVKKSLLYRITRLCYYLLLIIGVLIALSSLGFDFSNFLLIAGALGVGLGFGLQSIFNNFLSGIIILFESHLKVGDFIELESGLRGEIREINVRSTVITDNDGIDVLVPNSEIINNKVLNWTMKVPYRRVNVPFSTAYGVDKDLVAKIVVEAAMKVPHTLIKIGVPEPVVRLVKLGDNGLEFELMVWVKEKLTKRSRTTRSDYLWTIETVLRENRIAIPFPQLDLHIIKESKDFKNNLPENSTSD